MQGTAHRRLALYPASGSRWPVCSGAAVVESPGASAALAALVRIRLALELRIERRRPADPEPEPEFEHRDNDGTLSENMGHPRYVGFSPTPINPEERG